MEKSLEASELIKKRTLIGDIADVVPAMIAIYDIPSGKYLYVNKAVNKILGYRPSDFTDKGVAYVSSLLHPDDVQQILAKNQEALDKANTAVSQVGRNPVVNFEYRIKHKRGTWVWLHTDGIVYKRDKEGKVSHVLNVSIDITQRKEAEDRLRDVMDELLAFSDSKDEFVAIASHQLRTPATAVKQYLGLLLEGYVEPLTNDQENFLRLAYENNERQLHIVDDLLKVTQLDLDKMKLNYKKTDLVGLIGESIESLGNVFKKKRQVVEFKPSSKQIIVRVDPIQIKAVVENILENASNYSHLGKKIYVKVKKVRNEEGGICVSIKDEGVGISDKDFPRLFKKFSRIRNELSDSVSGSGLGLYFCLKIIELHGGYLRVRSAAGEGSEFSINLPKKLTAK